MVLVFYASSYSSPRVRRAVERAVHDGLRILPFRIEDVPPSKSLEYLPGSQHWLDGFPSPRVTHYERLCASLRRWLTGSAAAIAPAPDDRRRFLQLRQ